MVTWHWRHRPPERLLGEHAEAMALRREQDPIAPRLSQNALARRVEELRGLRVRVFVTLQGRDVRTVDGVCQGLDPDLGGVVLSPSSQGERAVVSLAEIGAVTQLPVETPAPE